VKPAAPSKEVVLDAPDTTAGAPAKSTVANTAALDPNEEVVTKDPKIVAKSDVRPDVKPETKPELNPEAKPDTKEAAKAKALLDGKDAPKSADAPVRSVVQVGAFADLAKAREVRTKLESAGIKTYTQDVETKDGKRTRVRVGPFATKEEADKAAEKIRKLNLQATVLKL
jgi:DedD protein